MRVVLRRIGLILLVVPIWLPSRFDAQTATAQPKSVQKTAVMTVTGKLERVMGIGAETTGWAIQLEPEAMIEDKPVRSLEIDYHGARKLDSLENKRVKVSGKISHRHGVEAGDRIFLEVSSIREAKAK